VTGVEIAAEVELPRAEDNIERIVRYSLIGRPDFAHPFGGSDRTWAPHDLMIKFKRQTRYQGGHVVERGDWRLTNVELHAWLRLKSGNTSDRSDLLVEFEDLPHEWTNRWLAKDVDYRKVRADDFPYVADMIAASTPAAGELC
jgi:hypothetical protein